MRESWQITGEQRLHREAYIAGIDVMLNGVFDTVQLGHSVHPRGWTRRCNRHHHLDRGPLRRHGGRKPRGDGLHRFQARCRRSDMSMGEYACAKKGFGSTRCIRPGVNSPMITNEDFGRFVQEFPTIAANLQNPLLVENGLIEPEDVTNTILHLVSDTGRHITGSTVLVDAGFTNK